MDAETDTRIAYLGPEGTYSHQIAIERFGDSALLVKEDTIRGVYNALSPLIPFVVIPKDNSIFGPVTETYDLLRDEKMGSQIFVREELTLPIRHSFLVRKGAKLQDIKRVLSHEQALGQCTNFLSEKIPNATTERVHSTAAAATAILEREDTAAICSKVCAAIYEGLEVLYEGIQNEDINYTKFWVLSTSQSVSLPGLKPDYGTRGALLRARAPSHQANLVYLFGSIQFPVVHIDRRPSLTGPPFQDVYFLELQHEGSRTSASVDSSQATNKQKSPQEWDEDATRTLIHIRNAGWNCDFLGSW